MRHVTRSRRRRGGKRSGRLALVSAVLLLGSQIALLGTASAYINAGVFELEGDATDGAAAGIDWDLVHEGQMSNPETCPSGATACGWEADGAANATIFTGGGSKDPQDISSWKWKDQSGGLPDKDNLQHSFAARFTAGGDELLYFGSDRFDNSGDAHQAFWFFQNEISLNDDGTFDGVHRNGDLLVISEFSNGGTVSTIVIYKWNSAVTGNLELLASGTDAKCTSNSLQPYCGIVNSADGTASPWSFLDKKGNTTFAQGEFFEGGINLSHSSINLGGQCFASFASETRSSTSTTAVLKDFVLGGFGRCGSTTVTTPKQSDGTTNVPPGGIGLDAATGTAPVKDSALVSVSGGNVAPTGSVAFWLCGPTATDSLLLCDAGGTSVGSTSIAAGNTNNPVTVVSPLATVSSAGRYCWRAVYSGDAAKGIPSSSDSSAGECFLVNPVTPTLTTTAGSGPVTLGSAVTDTAQLSGAAPQPGTPVITTAGIPETAAGAAADGTITFYLYGPSTSGCGSLAANFPVQGISRDVSGNGTYPTAQQSSVQFTPASPGTYNWVAVYSGSGPNTVGVTHNAQCTDTNERVVVQQLAPSIATAQSFVPNDSATVTVGAGGGAPSGSGLFEMFDNSNGTGTPLHSESVALPAGSDLSKTVSTSKQQAYTADKSFYWRVTFTSTNPSHTGTSHACGKERSSIDIDNNYVANP